MPGDCITAALHLRAKGSATAVRILLAALVLLGLVGCEHWSGGSDNTIRYSVTPAAGDGGNITPSDVQRVRQGETTHFTITPDSGYTINNVRGCGGLLDGDVYTTAAIHTNCTVTASFSVSVAPSPMQMLDGVYRGVMRSPKNLDFTDSTIMSFSVDEDVVHMITEGFHGRTCHLHGSLSGNAYPLSGSGTFDCSDFTEGTWSSSMIAKTHVMSSISEIEMAAGSDVYTIKVTGFRADAVNHYHAENDFFLSDVTLVEFPGVYDGRMQSLDHSCAALTFSNSPVDLSVSVDAGNIVIEQDAVFEGNCRFEGGITSFSQGVISAAGNYQCSNHDTGTWSTDHLVMTGSDSLFAELAVDVPARGCSYTVRYLGFKEEEAPAETESMTE